MPKPMSSVAQLRAQAVLSANAMRNLAKELRGFANLSGPKWADMLDMHAKDLRDAAEACAEQKGDTRR